MGIWAMGYRVWSLEFLKWGKENGVWSIYYRGYRMEYGKWNKENREQWMNGWSTEYEEQFMEWWMECGIRRMMYVIWKNVYKV